MEFEDGGDGGGDGGGDEVEHGPAKSLEGGGGEAVPSGSGDIMQEKSVFTAANT